MRRSLWMSLVALVAALAVAGSVLATHAPGGVVITDIQRGTLAEAVKSNNLGMGRIKFQTKGPVDVVVAEITFLKNGGSAGWHTHPGPVFVVIRTGTLSVWDQHCMKKTYPPGTVLFEPGPRHSMLVKNESPSTDVTLYATFIVPKGAAPLTVPTRHRCGIEG